MFEKKRNWEISTIFICSKKPVRDKIVRFLWDRTEVGQQVQPFLINAFSHILQKHTGQRGYKRWLMKI
jgi:hypothetical protein